MTLPLSGVSIIESAGADAPPGLVAAIGLCGRVAADLGASVVQLIVTPNQTAHPFLRAGKRALRVHDDGLQTHLIEQADILLSDAASPEGLSPRRVHAILSMDGTDAADSADSEFTIEARSGLLDIVGDPARSPLRLGGHQTAYAAGLAAFTAMMAAFSAPALQQGGARRIRISLLETAVWLNWKGLAVAARTDRAPRRAGGNGEWPVLPCADGYVAVVHRMQEWARLKDLVGGNEIDAECLQTVAGRRANRAMLNAILARYFAPLTRAEIHDISLRHKLPFGAVWTPAELLDDPQMLTRGMFRTDDSHTLPRLPVVWNEAVV